MASKIAREQRGIDVGFLIGFSIIIIFLISIDTQLRQGTKQKEEIIELLKKMTDNNR